MKTLFILPYLLVTSTIFATHDLQEEAYVLAKDETESLFQCYLATCLMQNKLNQPVYLRNALPQKAPSFVDITILNLELPFKLQAYDIAERILYQDPDVLHLTNLSTQTVSHLYEMIGHYYTDFIYIPKVPEQAKGTFIASKYPISEAEMTWIEKGDTSYKNSLEFVIHGIYNYNACISSNDLSIQIVNSNDRDDHTTTSILLGDLPGTLTVVKQEFSLLHLQNIQKTDSIAEEGFQFLPIRHREGGRDNDDKSRSFVEGSLDFKTGPNGDE